MAKVPSVSDLKDLDDRIRTLRAIDSKLKVSSWSTVKAALKWSGEKAATSVAKSGITALGAPTIPVHAALPLAGGAVTYSGSISPVGWALGPWIGAYKVGRTYGTVSSLYDLLPERSRKTDTHPCSCGTCKTTIGYVIDKIEWHAAETAIGVATLGVSELIRKPGKYLYRKVTGTHQKLPMCQQLHRSARPGPKVGGCKKAQAAVFVLTGDPETAVAVIVADDGPGKLKSCF